MIQLLSYKTQRSLNIAEAVITNNFPITYLEIQKLNNCSKKTVRDDLHYLKSQWSHLVDLELNANAVKTNYSNIYDLMLLKCNLFRGEVKIQLLLSIFLNPNLNIPQHSKKINYSESHLRRQITPINKYLKKFSCKIVMNREIQGYFVQSTNEVLTCFMISQLIKVSLNKKVLPPLQGEEFEEINKIFQEPFTFIPDEEKLDMDTFFQTILIRKKQGFYSQESIDRLQSEHVKLKSSSKLFEDAIDKYSLVFNKVLNDEDRLVITDIFVSIAIKTKLAPDEIDNYMNRFTYFYDSLKKENKKMTQIFESIVDEINTNYKIDYSSYVYELAFFFYTHIESLRSFKSLKIGVFSDFGVYHGRSLIISLVKHFPVHNFQYYNINEKYDLIISTQNKLDDVSQQKIIKVSDYITIRDINNIYTSIYLDTQKQNN